jgi:anti-anti-sigma factor
MGDTFARPADALHLSITRESSPAGARAPEVVVITTLGNLDRSTAPALETTLNRLLAAHCASLTVDLTGTDFMDVAALNVLVSAAERAGALGRPLRLVGCTRQALRLFGLAGAVDLFEAVAGREQPVVAPQSLPKTAHTDLPWGRSCTPHSVDKPATTSRPRPRGAVTSMRGDVGIEQG